MTKELPTEQELEQIARVVKKVMQEEQAAQGQANYMQVVDKNGRPIYLGSTQGEFTTTTTNTDPNAKPVCVSLPSSGHNVVPLHPDIDKWNKEYEKSLQACTDGRYNTESNQKNSPVDESLMNLEKNIYSTYEFIRILVKKLEPITYVTPASDTAQEIKPQHSIPLCATIERNTNMVVNIRKEIEYLLEYVGI